MGLAARVGWCVLAAVSGAACAPGDERTSSSSSSSGGGSSPLDGLCRQTAVGMAAFQAAYLGFEESRRSGTCPWFQPLSDEARAEALLVDYERFVEAVCDGAPTDDTQVEAYRRYWQTSMKVIRDGMDRGRVTYDAPLAAECDRLGVAELAPDGSHAAFLERAAAAGALALTLPPACLDFVRGLQPLGEPCGHHVECAPGDGGASCVDIGAGCQGHCVPSATEGEPCGLPRARLCARGLACSAPWSGAEGTCIRPGARGQPCQAVNPPAQSCETGLVCSSSGVCGDRLGADAGCQAPTDCAQELVCRGGRCHPPAGAGETCTSDSECEACLLCARVPEPWGAGACTAPALVGQPCTAARCAPPGVCFNGTCVQGKALGEACTDDLSGADPVHDCRGGLVCAGNPPVCQAPGEVGAGCRAPASSFGTRGTCRWGFTCARPAASATEGTCLPPARLGQACGARQDVPPQCRYDLDVGDIPQCTATTDGGVGRCYLPERGVAGDACMGACSPGFQCAWDGGEGTCVTGPALGEPCRYYYECRDSRCGYPDASSELHCLPLRSLGQACGSQGGCVPEAYCGWGDGGAVCQVRLALGASCEVSEQCAAGATCSDGVCLEAACAATQTYSYCADTNVLGYMLFLGLVVRWRRRGR
ncbi:MAG: hypothetical protein HY904_21325 [Deltaproteobacteria bacterium]|nr:hypothetical protein [Deltaproteobacteria bacterium]